MIPKKSKKSSPLDNEPFGVLRLSYVPQTIGEKSSPLDNEPFGALRPQNNSPHVFRNN